MFFLNSTWPLILNRNYLGIWYLYIPLIVPITLINHYVRKFDQPYLKEQVYPNSHPIELQLRNHV
jgi:hypothetical protein